MSLRIEYPHKLPDAEARERIKALGEYLANKHGIAVSWNGEDSATIRGKYMIVSIEGSVSLTPQLVVFDGKDPGMLWRGKAKDYLSHKLEKYLNPVTPISDLPRR